MQTEIDIEKIARLSKLTIEPQKREMFLTQMKNIIGMVENLTDSGEGSIGVDESRPMRLRKDEIGPSLTRGQVLMNAPQKQAGCVVVPKTVE